MQSTTGTPLSARTDESGSRSRPGGTPRTLFPFVAVGLLTLAADQLSKLWALRSLDDGHTVRLVGSLLRLRLIHNPGAAFSIGNSMTWVMTTIAVVVSLAIVAAAWRAGSRRWAYALGLLLGGSLGNLWDRFLRDPGPGRGHVVDFIDYGGLFVGNVADIAIVGGALGLIWLTMRDVNLDGSVGGRHAAAEPKGDAAKEEDDA